MDAPPTPPQEIKVNDVVRWLRLLEERYTSLRNKTQFFEQNMLRDSKATTDEMRALRQTIAELKAEVADVDEKMHKLTEEMGQATTKVDVHTLAKYLSYWQPMDFITRKEAESLIAEKIKRNK